MSGQNDGALRQLEAELAALNREWHRTQERFLEHGPDGQLHEPGGGRIAPAILMMVASVVLMAFVAASPLPSFVAWIGLIPFALGTFRLLSGSMKTEAYERARTAYESQRRQLLMRIAAFQTPPGPENSR